MGKRPDVPATGGGPSTGPASFLAAAAALAAIDDAVRTARNTAPDTRPGADALDEGPVPPWPRSPAPSAPRIRPT
ncbi:hypothetical protein [Kitasatospora sp. NPDC091276]|uniref:hypothetical protein n=1 Tax=Kitasatospora sp. NPDC091276 TaxID=3155300 RepID=UPI00343BA9CC